MAGRKKWKGCTVNLGTPDTEFHIPEGCVRMWCANCNTGWWDRPGARCGCGARLRIVTQLNRLTLGAVKAAMLRKD